MNPARDPPWQGSHLIFGTPRFAEIFARETGQVLVPFEGGMGFLSRQPVIGASTFKVYHASDSTAQGLAAITTQARKARSARLQIITTAPLVSPEPSRCQPLETRILDLGPGEEQLWEAIGPNTRRKIRRSKRAGVTAHLAETDADFESFWSIYRRVASQKGFPAQPRSLVETLFRDPSLTTLIVTRRAGVVIGGMFFWTEAYPVYWIGGFERIAEAPYTGSLTLWEATRLFRDQGAALLDLGGADPTPGHGPTAFKDTFHGEVRMSYQSTLTLSPLKGRLLDWGETLIRLGGRHIRR